MNEIKINVHDSSKLQSDFFLKYFMLAIFPILSLYHFIPLISIGYGMLILIIFICGIKQKFKLYINSKLFITMAILIMFNLLVGVTKYFDMTNTINNTASMIMFTFIASIICTPGFLNAEKLYKACKLVGLIATIFLFYQFIGFHYFGIVITGNIDFLIPIDYAFGSIGRGRPTSFFFEPAHYSIFIAPIYAMSLLKKEYKYSLIFFLGLIFSTSTSGIIISLIVPLLIFVKKDKKNIIKTIIIIISGSIFIYILTKYFYGGALQKISVDNIMNSIRIFGTVDYFKFFSLSEWLFGIGLNRLTDYFSYLGFFVPNYANAYIFSILSFGLIGGSIWIIYNISLYKNVLKNYRSIYFILILISFSDQIIFNRHLLYLLIWVHAVFAIKKSSN